jgi:Tol biopolymer transport system component
VCVEQTIMRVGRLAGVLAAVAVATAAFVQPSSASPHRPAAYATARFVVHSNSYAFGQAPVFMPDGSVLFGKDFGTGLGIQVYRADRDGSHLRCLTCELKSKSDNVPAPRPQGDWILFHSWMGHNITVGSAGYGGIGSELYVMRPNGSHVTKLYGLHEPDDGEGTDDYHAYWSPDGKRIVWAHFNGNFITGGGRARWDIRVANFVVRHGVPKLVHVRVVRPANGHWYETQWWAPNGKGFLYTETYGSTDNTELFYCRLPKRGMCHSERLTDNAAWDEQAIFTPDMKDVIFMSSRDHPGFYNTFSTVAQDLGLTTELDNFLILPVFELGFLQPIAQESTDLYELNLRTRAVRRLTFDGDQGWVTPEFTWDPSGRELWWTENRIPPDESVRLPLDVLRQLALTVELLEHPEIDPGTLRDFGTLPIRVQQRTRVAHFVGVQEPASFAAKYEQVDQESS